MPHAIFFSVFFRPISFSPPPAVESSSSSSIKADISLLNLAPPPFVNATLLSARRPSSPLTSLPSSPTRLASLLCRNMLPSCFSSISDRLEGCLPLSLLKVSCRARTVSRKGLRGVQPKNRNAFTWVKRGPLIGQCRFRKIRIGHCCRVAR